MLSRPRAPVVALSLLTLCPVPALADGNRPDLDLSAVHQVEITGDASMITMVASATGPYGITLSNRRKGWFANWQSSWFFDSCATASRASLEGDRLKVHTVTSSWYSLSDCVVEVQINLPKETAVAIHQDAAFLRMDGDFARITAQGNAMDFGFDGHTSELSLSGKAMHVRASYDRVEKNEQIDIHSNALMADLELGRDTPVDFAAKGTATFIENRLPNAPGALPKIRIEGDFVNASLR